MAQVMPNPIHISQLTYTPCAMDVHLLCVFFFSYMLYKT